MKRHLRLVAIMIQVTTVAPTLSAPILTRTTVGCLPLRYNASSNKPLP